MPDVRMPDGTVIRNVPEGTTRSELTRRLQAAQQGGQGAGAQMANQLGQNFQQPPAMAGQQIMPASANSAPQRNTVRDDPSSGSFLSTIANSGARTFVNNLLATPSATGDLLAAGAGAVQTIAETPFSEQGFGQRIRQNIESQQQQFPANALRSIPRPTVEGISAAMQAAPALAPGGETFGDAFGARREEIQQRQDQSRQQAPVASMVGEIGGDIATIAAGRSPFATRLARSSTRAPVLQNRQAREALETLSREQPELVPQVAQLMGSGRLASPGATRMWRRITESDAVRSTARGAGKAVETGLEGAVLAAIKENDPFTNAGLAAGGQALTSILGSTLGVPGSMKGLAVRAAGYFTLFRTLQEFGPGENDVFTATDTAFDKLALGITIGLASQFAGGRFRGSSTLGNRFAEDLPKISDAINTIPRGALLSVANQVQREQESGENITLPTLQTLQQSPDLFSPTIRNRLDRAMRNGNLSEEIEKLRDNNSFLQTLEESMDGNAR